MVGLSSVLLSYRRWHHGAEASAGQFDLLAQAICPKLPIAPLAQDLQEGRLIAHGVGGQLQSILNVAANRKLRGKRDG
jgi:hypothetical protein